MTCPVFCLGGDPHWAETIAKALPDRAVRAVTAPELETLPESPPGAVLAVCDAPEPELARLRGLHDAAGLPRWAVVAFTSSSATNADALSRDEWRPAIIAQTVQSALAVHRLQRENGQLRGDIRAFATRVAHDLRTPLGGILTTAEMLREILGQESPDQASFVGPIVDSAEAQAALIERTSFYGKAVSSTAALEPFDMGAAFWNAYQQLEGRMFKVQATVKHASTWPPTRGHAGWTEVIWRNLLTNSLQHGGAAVQIEAGWTERDQGYEFWVKDTGTVPEAKRGTLFFPFHLLHSPSAPRGLGLPITRRLVELQGGTCGYEPLGERGSRFHFTLPKGLAPR
jgi:signal transduction histidine kinase